MNSIKHALGLYRQAWFPHYFNFTGKTTYAEYWQGIVPVTAVIFFVYLTLFGIWLSPQETNHDTAFTSITLLRYTYLVIFALPWLSASARRLRDAGINPWWVLLGLTPLTALVVLIMANQGRPIPPKPSDTTSPD